MCRRGIALAAIFAVVAGCSTTHQKQTGLASSLEGLDKSEFPCNRSDEMHEYLRGLWSSIQSKWVPPPDAKATQVVVLAMEFDGRGDTRPPEIVEANSSDLRSSVEKAYREANLPEPSETLRACLAGQRIKAKFSAHAE